MTTETRETVCLPMTFKAIAREFPGRNSMGLRDSLRAAAKGGSVGGLGGSIALTASVRASLRAVAEVLDREWAERGYDRCYVGPDEDGTIVAYLDQPI